MVAEEYGVSVGTVKRAFAELQRERLIFTRQGQGSYVRAQGDTPEPEAATSDVHELLAEIVRRLDVIERKVGIR
jgi:DNA-binding GntR family transcriptional regulator